MTTRERRIMEDLEDANAMKINPQVLGTVVATVFVAMALLAMLT